MSLHLTAVFRKEKENIEKKEENESDFLKAHHISGMTGMIYVLQIWYIFFPDMWAPAQQIWSGLD